MANMEIYKKCMEFKKRTGRWPRTKIIIDGKKYAKKDLLELKKLYGTYADEFIEEFELAGKWLRSDEYKLLVGNMDKEIEEFPKKYQNMIRNLREMGLGFSRKRSDIVSRCEKFYKKYGRAPERVTKEQATNEEKRLERRLYNYLSQNGVRNILEDYISMEIEDIPKEHQEMVRRFRAIGMGVESQKSTNVKDYIDFVTEKKREPVYYANPKNVIQADESSVRHKWRMSKVHEIYTKYQGYFIQEVPEEYRDIVSQIRDLWLKIDGNRVADEVIEYIEKNQREPREINVNFQQFENGLTEEDQREKLLNEKWNRCFEKHVIERFVGTPIKEIPVAYREIVTKMRAVGLGHPESLNTRLFIDYTLNHHRKPRQVICRNGKRVDQNFWSEDEKKEIAIRRRWDSSEDKKVYDMYLQGKLDEEAVKFYENMLQNLDKAAKAEKLGMQEKKAETARRNREKNEKKKAEKRAAKIEKQRQIEEEKKSTEAIKNYEKREERDRLAQVRAAKKELEKKRLAEEKLAKKELEKKRLAEEKMAKKELEKKRIAEERLAKKAEQERIAKEQERLAKEEEKQKLKEQKKETAKQIAKEKRQAKARAVQEEKRKKQREQSELNALKTAKDYITFIKQNGREPRMTYRENGKDMPIADYPEDAKKERLLRQSWEKCEFIDIIERLTGVPIEKVPDKYQAIIQEFRDIGLGLTYDEYEKFRATKDPRAVIFSAKATRAWAIKKRAKAKALASEVKEELSRKEHGKEHNDE